MSDGELPQTPLRNTVVPLGTLDQTEAERGPVGDESLQERSPTPVTSAKKTISRAEARISSPSGTAGIGKSVQLERALEIDFLGVGKWLGRVENYKVGEGK
jgi:hypothetical protein